MAKKRKTSAGKVTTNFKQNHRRKGPGTTGGARARSAGPSGKTGDFDPDANVRQIGQDVTEPTQPQPAGMAVGPAPPMASEEMPSTGRAIPRYPEEV